MISADIKIDVNQQEIKELVTVSYNSYRSTLSKNEIQIKQACIFHLILIGIPSSLMQFLTSKVLIPV